ncbi:agmatine deiminase family protein [Nostoc sp. CHAB 5844]|nr:agmatine deiminase family protein [Nostoc sp. CHAB 5844]
MLNTVVIAIAVGAAALALIGWLVPKVAAKMVRSALISANQGMAYHLMNGEQITTLSDAAFPAIARLLGRKNADAIATLIRAREQWQITSTTRPVTGDQLVGAPQIRALFNPAFDIGSAMAQAPVAAALITTRGPARYNPVEPPVRPHLPAEHQPMRGAIVHWPVGYLDRWPYHAQLVQAITAGGEAHVVVRDETWARLVLAYLREHGVGLDCVRLILAPTDDYWVRDSGPTIIATQDGAAAIVNPYIPNGLGYHKRDSEAGIEAARVYGIPVHRLPLIVEGGNIVPDGEGGLFMCDSVLARNPDIDEASLREIVAHWFGIDRLIMLPSLPGDITGHADIVVKVAEAGVLIVTEAPRGHPWHAALENAAGRIAVSTAAGGRPWTVHRMPMPGGRRSEWTYVNALTVNDVIVAPSYCEVADQRAAAVFRAASPGRTVHWIDYRAVLVGAVHCQTKELPALPGLLTGAV